MTPRGWRRPARQLAAGVVAALLVGTASAASAPLQPGPEHGDLVASAQADSDDPTVLDEAVQTTWPRGTGSQADAVSTASATCDGCHARTVTVQVVLADRGGDGRLMRTTSRPRGRPVETAPLRQWRCSWCSFAGPPCSR